MASILLINDNKIVSRLLKLSSQKNGYDLEEVTALPASKDTYDFVFVDSEQYDTALLQQIRDTLHFQKLVYIGMKNETLPDGFDLEIEKPFLPTDFVKMIEENYQVSQESPLSEEVGAEEKKQEEDELFNLDEIDESLLEEGEVSEEKLEELLEPMEVESTLIEEVETVEETHPDIVSEVASAIAEDEGETKTEDLANMLEEIEEMEVSETESSQLSEGDEEVTSAKEEETLLDLEAEKMHEEIEAEEKEHVSDEDLELPPLEEETLLDLEAEKMDKEQASFQERETETAGTEEIEEMAEREILEDPEAFDEMTEEAVMAAVSGEEKTENEESGVGLTTMVAAAAAGAVAATTSTDAESGKEAENEEAIADILEGVEGTEKESDYLITDEKEEIEELTEDFASLNEEEIKRIFGESGEDLSEVGTEEIIEERYESEGEEEVIQPQDMEQMIQQAVAKALTAEMISEAFKNMDVTVNITFKPKEQ